MATKQKTFRVSYRETMTAGWVKEGSIKISVGTGTRSSVRAYFWTHCAGRLASTKELAALEIFEIVKLSDVAELDVAELAKKTPRQRRA